MTTTWDRQGPQLYWDIIDAVSGITIEDIHAAVGAACASVTADMSTEEKQEVYRKLLRPICAEYAASIDVGVDLVCDALVTVMQRVDDDGSPEKAGK